MTIQVVTFKIIGVSSLLMKNPKSMLLDDKENKSGSKVTAAKKKYDPEKIAEACSYRMDDGTLCARSNWFKCAILNACVGCKIEKKSASTYVKQAGLFPMEENLPLFDLETNKPITDYVINEDSGVIDRSRILIWRPEIFNWACNIAFEYDNDFINEKIALELLNYAGYAAGVGDYRVNKKGTHGRFKAELVSST